MAEIVIGDYKYNTDGSVKVVDKTKQTYGPILSQFEYGGNFYAVTNMYACFADCASLTQAPVIPGSITNLGYCFDNCISLTLAPPVIPNGVTNMFGCFYGCTSLTQAPEIPSGVTDMRYCFYDCPSLTQAPEIPSSVTKMTYCFYHCSSLTQAPVIPSDVTDMGSCFKRCTSLTQAPVIPSDVIDMEGCFDGCTSLIQAPEIPSSVKYIRYCFRDCISLTQAPEELPSGVEDIRYCFSGCSLLIQAPEIPNGVINMESCFSGCSSLTQTPEIPNGVTNMESCFRGCSSLTQTPEIPSSVKYIRYCFSGCSLLTQPPEIPSDVTNMRECFSDCTSLTQAPKIPSGVTDMRLCFYNCYKLKGDINVYNNPTDFNNIFYGTTNDIYIVNCATTTKEAVAEKWRTIASNYNKVHYEADDHPEPQLSLSVRRTDENKKSSSMGSYLVFQKSYIISQDLLPENFTPAYVESETYKLDNEVILPIVDISGESEAIQLGDPKNGHIVSYTLNDGYKTKTITANLSKTMAILDFLGKGNQAGYIDLPGMGMAIGNIATRNGLDIQFPTTIGEGLLPPTTNKVYTKAELPFDNSKTYYILNDDKYEEVINPVEEDIDNYYELTSQSVDLSNYQLVIGKYNKRDDKALFIIGNGTADNRKNSFIIDEDGYMDVVNGFEIKVEDKALLQFLKIDDSDTRIRLGAADGSNIVIGDLGIEMFHVLADKNAKSYIHNETLVETLPSEDLAGSCLSLANNSDVPNGTINKVELRAINGTTYNNWAVVSATIKKLANGTNQNIIRFDANRVESRVAIVVDSDRRLKKHINYLDKDAIDFCRELKPVIYSKNDEKHLGFYAQDVKEINKWDADLTPLINKDYMGLSYDELIAPLVAYCQYLEKRIDELESQK